MTDKPKFNIGDELFHVQSSCRYGVKVPCTICFGKLRVAIILGNGEHVNTECGHCSAGIDPPSGYSTTWKPHAYLVNGPVTGVTREYDGWKYTVGGYTVHECELFTTGKEASPVMESKLKEETERREAYERDHFITATKKQVWSAGYHRDRIADCERTMDWHKMRLCMTKEKAQSLAKTLPHKKGPE